MGLLYVRPTLFVNNLLRKLIYTNYMSTKVSKPP